VSKHKKSPMARLGASRSARLSVMGGVLASAGAAAALSVGTANAANETVEVRPIVIDGSHTPKNVNSVMVEGCEKRTKAECTLQPGQLRPSSRCIKNLTHDGRNIGIGITQFFVKAGSQLSPDGVNLRPYTSTDCDGGAVSHPTDAVQLLMDNRETTVNWWIHLDELSNLPKAN
jgi:hypothetical protein